MTARPPLKIMFLETQLDLELSSIRTESRFMREFLGNFGRLDLIMKEVHSRADLEKFLDYCRVNQEVRALHIVSHGMRTRHESCIVLTDDEVVDLTSRGNRDLFADLGVESIFLSCCQLGKDRGTMRRLLESSGAVALFSYGRDVDDYQAFLTESLFYHLAYGYVRGRRSDLTMQQVYDRLTFSLEYLGVDRADRSSDGPLLAAVFADVE